MNSMRFDGLRRAPILVAVLLLAACTTIEETSDEAFTRSSLLIDAIDRAEEAGDVGRVVNLVSYGFETELLDRDAAIIYFDRTVAAFRERYDRSIAERDLRSAIRAEQNLRVLAENRIDPASVVPLDGLRSRDDLLFEWSQMELARDEAVLGLYLMLRRSTLGDLRGQVLRDYIDVARELNHDEALHRLLRIAEQRELSVPPPGGSLDTPADRPADMLAGTVTIWVNRGIRIQNGVGVPDRVIGSGFFVDPRGYLITNYHVISSEVDPEYEGFSRLFIKLPGRPDERVPARVIGYDRIFDLALLKVEIDPAYVFSLSDTRELEPGEAVLALGSPGGLDSTITSGIVSASGRR
ncbi:MAG: S1C family serine protease, partial [Spirochaetales bacterium]|nr:S1C family serine protease [Spirochaetales bacterium]